MVNSGDQPGVGTYQCLECGYIHAIEKEDEVLPPCPVCGGLEWAKLD